MIENIVAAGCSFIAGGSLKVSHSKDSIPLTPNEQSKQRASRLVADNFYSQEFNIANEGGSNDRAIRQIYEWTKLHPNKVSNTVFILGLTEVLRQEKYCAPANDYVKWRGTVLLNNLYKLEENQLSYKLVPGSFKFREYLKENGGIEELIQYAKTEFMLFTSIEHEFERLSRNLDMLNSYISMLGGTLIVFAAMLELDIENRAEFNIHGDINTENLNFMTFPGGYRCWKSYIKSYDSSYNASFHPLVNDDKKLATLLVDYINTLKK